MRAQDLFETIKMFESRGLGARKPGEEFVAVDDPNQKIYVDSITFYPEEGGQYQSTEELLAALEQVKNDNSGIAIQNVAEFKKNDLAFGLAVFATTGGTKLGFIKPFKQVALDPTLNNWDNQRGIPGYRYNSKAAAKAQAGMTPQDVLTQPSNLTPDDIVDQISDKFGRKSPLTLLAANLANGAELPLEIAATPEMSFTAFRDYFCELLHPIALHVGSYSGNAGEAAEKFLDGGDFADTLISFGSDKTEGLSDSILIANDGTKIKVSSKGAAGAQASSKNLLDAANELKANDPKLYKKHRATIDLVEEIKNAGQAEAPLLLGTKFNIISEKDAQAIRDMKGQQLMPLAAVESMKISKNLKKLIKERSTDNVDRVNFFFHSLAAVAHKVADYVNENTGFSKAASAILNNGALIQVYTKATDKKTKWVLNSFETVWPSATVTGVKFSASKTYYSTGIKGNFTFKILRNNATDVDTAEPAVVNKVSARAAPKLQGVKQLSAKPKSTDIGRKKLK